MLGHKRAQGGQLDGMRCVDVENSGVVALQQAGERQT